MSIPVAFQKYKQVYDGFCKIVRVPRNGGSSHMHDVVIASDSICLVIYCQDRDEFIFVKQRRPAMITVANPEGWSVEVVAGRHDIFGKNIYEIAVLEAWQEARIEILPKDISLFMAAPITVSPGLVSEKIWLANVVIHSDQIKEPDESMFGDQESGEFTERIIVKRSDLALSDYNGSVPTLLAMTLFLQELLSQELSVQVDKLKQSVEKARTDLMLTFRGMLVNGGD